MLRHIESALNPVGLAWLALIAAAFALRSSHRRFSRILFALVLFIWLLGATPLHAWLLSRLERPYLRSVAQNAPAADAAVVLGGMIATPSPEAGGFVFSTASGRFISGIALAKSKKVPVLVFGGGPHGQLGRPHYQSGDPPSKSEGDYLKSLISEWNLLGCEVIALPPSLTTRDEFLHFSSLAQQRRWTNVLLVTSAWHMTRSRATFYGASFQVTPVAADFIGFSTLNSGRLGFRLIPAVEPLCNISTFVHEILGLAWYKLRGWI